MRQAILALATALLLAPAAAFGADEDEALSDRRFVEWATQANLLEIELGKLGAEKAADSKVRNFAERMVSDHREAQEQLREAAQAQGIAPFEEQLSEEAQAVVEQLSELSGAAFDRAYVARMNDSHDRALARYEEQSQDAETLVQVYAADLRPILRKHREIAEKMVGENHIPAATLDRQAD